MRCLHQKAIEKIFDKYKDSPKPPRLHAVVQVMVAVWRVAADEKRPADWSMFTEEYCTMICNKSAEVELKKHPHLHSMDVSHYLEMGSMQRRWWLEDIPDPEEEDDPDGALL